MHKNELDFSFLEFLSLWTVPCPFYHHALSHRDMEPTYSWVIQNEKKIHSVFYDKQFKTFFSTVVFMKNVILPIFSFFFFFSLSANPTLLHTNVNMNPISESFLLLLLLLLKANKISDCGVIVSPFVLSFQSGGVETLLVLNICNVRCHRH